MKAAQRELWRMASSGPFGCVCPAPCSFSGSCPTCSRGRCWQPCFPAWPYPSLAVLMGHRAGQLTGGGPITISLLGGPITISLLGIRRTERQVRRGGPATAQGLESSSWACAQRSREEPRRETLEPMQPEGGSPALDGSPVPVAPAPGFSETLLYLSMLTGFHVEACEWVLSFATTQPPDRAFEKCKSDHSALLPGSFLSSSAAPHSRLNLGDPAPPTPPASPPAVRPGPTLIRGLQPRCSSSFQALSCPRAFALDVLLPWMPWRDPYTADLSSGCSWNILSSERKLCRPHRSTLLCFIQSAHGLLICVLVYNVSPLLELHVLFTTDSSVFRTVPDTQ